MLTNKVVVVTGGAGLIGKEFIRGIVERKGIAIIAENDIQKAEVLKKKLQAENNKYQIESLYVDINDKKSINDLISKVHEKYGKLDALINNAYPKNKNFGKHFFDVEYEDFCENLVINLGGYFLISQQVASFFIKQGYGNIINISSIYGVMAPRFEVYDNTPMTMPVEYAAIKSGLIHLTKYLAKYLKGKNIRVNSISPGGVYNQQDPLFVENYKGQALNKGMLDPGDLVGTLVFLISDESLYINGQNLVVDDGFTL